MIFRCDLVPQYNAYKNEIGEAIERVLHSGRYILANEVNAFEKEFAHYQEVPYAASVANATDGLILTMKALNIGPGDEVITTSFTAIPTLSAIVASGAKPVFVDIDEKTFLIDLRLVKKAITKRTKAVIPVHLFGNVVNIIELRNIIGKKILIIEDAAQAHGSTFQNLKAGSIGDAGVFSFYPTKNLGGYGDGGIVVSKNRKLIEKIKLLRMYGMTDKDHIVINGVNSRLDELQAAILRVKLPHLDEMNKKRNVIARLYREKLNPDLFEQQKIPQDIVSNYHVFSMKVKKNRNQFIAHMDKAGIQTNIYYLLPLHLQKATRYLGKKQGSFPKAEKLSRHIVALPMYPELGINTCEHIIKTINEFKGF